MRTFILGTLYQHILGGAAALNASVLFHEIGHFVAARCHGVQPTILQVGHGPAWHFALFGQPCGIGSIPVGGKVDIPDAVWAELAPQPKAWISLAGPLASLSTALLLFWIFRRDQRTFSDLVVAAQADTFPWGSIGSAFLFWAPLCALLSTLNILPIRGIISTLATRYGVQNFSCPGFDGDHFFEAVHLMEPSKLRHAQLFFAIATITTAVVIGLLRFAQ